METGIEDADTRVTAAEAALNVRKGPPLPTGLTNAWFYAANMGAGLNSTGLANEVLRVIPVKLSYPVTIDGLSIYVQVAGEATSVFRFGIYADDGSGFPGALILDAGTVATATTGNKILAIAALALQPGLYWFGGVIQAAPTTTPALNSAANEWTPPILLPQDQNAPQQGNVGARATVIAGALPTPFPTALRLGNCVTAPRVAFRVP